MAAILAGRELGLPPMTSLRHVQVVEGSPGLSAEYKRARVLSAGHKLDVGQHDTEACEITGHRKGHKPVTVRFTIADARKAGIYKPRGAWDDPATADAVRPRVHRGLRRPVRRHHQRPADRRTARRGWRRCERVRRAARRSRTPNRPRHRRRDHRPPSGPRRLPAEQHPRLPLRPSPPRSPRGRPRPTSHGIDPRRPGARLYELDERPASPGSRPYGRSSPTSTASKATRKSRPAPSAPTSSAAR